MAKTIFSVSNSDQKIQLTIKLIPSNYSHTIPNGFDRKANPAGSTSPMNAKKLQTNPSAHS
jgi:hypothetical protein